ncbi:MAG: glycosyltransferase family 2 protein [Planctomycetaceae bacterium]|nr:glycosyltransferase family 2 protein [Planctomycetaceae bacterium]
MPEIVPQLVSAVIPVFNRPEMLQRAVQSVLNQTYQPVEVLIADDGSTDETPQVARSLERDHPGVVFYHPSPHAAGCGPGPMRELGRQRARGEFVQYLDSDDLLMPNKFTDQVNTLRHHPECDIAYGITRLVDEAGSVLADPFKWTGRDITRLYPGLLVDRWWCTHTPLYRRTLTDRIGPWSDLRWSQDWEYDARAGALGVSVVSCHSHVSDHVHHSGVRQTSNADWQRDPARLRNRVQLLHALWHNAVVAQIANTAPERQHFSRWCFAIARQCAVAGLCQETYQLIDLARQAAADSTALKGITLFENLARCLGVTGTGHIFRILEQLRRQPGSLTLPQSFTRSAETSNTTTTTHELSDSHSS